MSPQLTISLNDGNVIPQLGFGVWQVPNEESVTPSRIRENFDVFDFSLDAEDLAKIAALDRKDGRIGSDPETAEF